MMSLKRTALFDIYKKYGGKIVPYAGYEMPVFFKTGALKEHTTTRESVGLFDVSHMGIIRFTGTDREAFLEHVTTIDLKATMPCEGRYTLILNEQGGVKDDCIVTKFDDFCRMVVNAECKDKDVTHLLEQLAVFNGDVKMEVIDDFSLIALQGPKAVTSLAKLVKDDISRIPFMSSCFTTTRISNNHHNVQISRCGYTGEDGFEVSMRNIDALDIVNELLSDDSVIPVGLAARDSLRLEAGMCLYSHELTETTTPMDARLMWTIAKRRIADGGFIGHKSITDILKDTSLSARQVRVGLMYPAGAIARSALIKTKHGDGTEQVVGRITSSVFSPTLKTNIAQGYLNKEVSTPGTASLYVDIRGNPVDIQVVKLPFINTKYFK